VVTTALCAAAAPRQRQRIYVARAACTQRLRTGIDRRSGGEHVVNQRDARRRRRTLPHKRTSDILDTTGRVEQRLLPGRSDPHQRSHNDRQTCHPGDLTRQQFRLIEPTFRQTVRVERHRDERITGERMRAQMVCEQCAEWTRHALPAAVFELVYRLTKRTIEHIRYPHPGQLIGNPRRLAIICHQATTARSAQQRAQLTTSDAAIRQKQAENVIDPSEQHYGVPCA
jgi:hypothetical protein